MSERKCGDCTLCCKLIAVGELEKPQDVWCEHCNQKSGCRIFGQPERPQSCKDFQCLWLMGLTPESFRPKEAKFVLWLTTDGKRITLFEDEGYPGAWKKPPYRKYLMELVDRGIDLIVIRGKERTIFTSQQETLDQLKQLKEEPTK